MEDKNEQFKVRQCRKVPISFLFPGNDIYTRCLITLTWLLRVYDAVTRQMQNSSSPTFIDPEKSTASKYICICLVYPNDKPQELVTRHASALWDTFCELNQWPYYSRSEGRVKGKGLHLYVSFTSLNRICCWGTRAFLSLATRGSERTLKSTLKCTNVSSILYPNTFIAINVFFSIPPKLLPNILCTMLLSRSNSYIVCLHYERTERQDSATLSKHTKAK